MIDSYTKLYSHIKKAGISLEITYSITLNKKTITLKHSSAYWVP